MEETRECFVTAVLSNGRQGNSLTERGGREGFARREMFRGMTLMMGRMSSQIRLQMCCRHLAFEKSSLQLRPREERRETVVCERDGETLGCCQH